MNKADAVDLAKYIITKCAREGDPISNLQLQRILYYIQREFLKKTGRGAFDDRIEAWAYGPVVRSVYNRFCGSGAIPITMSFSSVELNEESAELIDEIVEEKRDIDPWNLAAYAKQKGGAWDVVYRDGLGQGDKIPDGLIKDLG